MSNVIDSTKQKTLMVVSNMLFHIHKQLENDSNAVNNIDIQKLNDNITIKYLGFTLVSNKNTYVKVCYNSDKYICIFYEDKYRYNFNDINNMVKLICDKRDELLVLESYKLLENGFQTILVDSFNTYMIKLNIPYQVSNTDQINWQHIFNNIEDVPMDFLSTFYNIIDWKIFARWGKFSIKELISKELLQFLFNCEYLIYNVKCSVADKLYLTEDWEDYQITDVTEQFIKDREKNGAVMDNLLDQYIANGLPIDFELLSKEYPLPAELITKYLNKFSIDNMLKNDKIKCDILVIVNQIRVTTATK
jgi:hypothetical protein